MPAAPNSQQIFLVSAVDEQTRLLRRQLEPLTLEFHPLEFISSRPQNLVTSTDRQTAAIVLQLSAWTDEEMKTLRALRRGGFKGPLIALLGYRTKAPQNPASNLLQAAAAAFGPVVFLDQSGESTDLQGVLRKYLTAERVQQQAFRRYPTEQSAEIEYEALDGSVDRHLSKLVNLSKGGAFVECLSPVPLGVGENFQLKLELHDLNRSYRMPARIVWAKKSARHGGIDFGVEFTGPALIRPIERRS